MLRRIIAEGEVDAVSARLAKLKVTVSQLRGGQDWQWAELEIRGLEGELAISERRFTRRFSFPFALAASLVV